MLIFPLRKADAMQRRVYARLDETVDRAGEAMDYAASVPVFKAWSDAQAAQTSGKSRGNVRSQHGRIAAGVVSEISFDDDARAIEFGIDVVDDGEWDKVIKGVYTGISPGGSAARRKEATGVVRYAVTSLNELSLVDIPCSPAATFTLIKADGVEEEVDFAAPEDIHAARHDLMKALSDAASPRDHAALLAPLSVDRLEKLFGGAAVEGPLLSATTRRDLAQSGAALADGSYPVVDAETLEAGFAALAKADGDFPDIRAHLAARGEALGLHELLAREAGDTPLRKGLFAVGRLSEIIGMLTSLAEDAACEANWEGDGSDIPARLTAWIAAGASILVAMAGEESAEAVASLQAAVAALPAAIVQEPDSDDAPVEKAYRLDTGLLLKATVDLAASRSDLEKAHAATEAVRAELAALKKQPAPGGPRLRAVSRGDDVGPADTEPGGDLLKAYHAMPDGIEKARAGTRLVMAGILPGYNQ